MKIFWFKHLRDLRRDLFSFVEHFLFWMFSFLNNFFFECFLFWLFSFLNISIWSAIGFVLIQQKIFVRLKTTSTSIAVKQCFQSVQIKYHRKNSPFQTYFFYLITWFTILVSQLFFKVKLHGLLLTNSNELLWFYWN